MGIKLTRIEIRGYRSIPETIRLDVAPGANALVGPNNVGKSNLLRALGLVFGEGDGGFDFRRDAPAGSRRARPTVTVDLAVVPPVQGFERTLLRYAGEAESAVLADRPSGESVTYASERRLRLRVKYSREEGRSEYIVTRGAGDRRAPSELNRKAIEQLRSAVRFVLVRSGEGVDAFLRGRFSEVLANVLAGDLYAKLEDARETRERYVADLATTLFGALEDEVLSDLHEMVPELRGVSLRPNVPSIEETIGGAEVLLEDAAATGLEGKGTGVRGGLLVAMLKYLAEQSRRSLVLAVEEPESFLHPAAQELIREDLETVAERDDVTLLFTTHSPFVIPRAPQAQVVALEKSPDGHTQIATAVRGDEPRVDAIAGLFSSRLLAGAIEEIAATEIDESCQGILVVEGDSDRTFLSAAARIEGRPELLEGIHIHASSGADAAAHDAILWRAKGIAPTLVLLDHDIHGRSARGHLVKGFDFAKGDVLTYRKAFEVDDCEAEWLISESLFDRFLVAAGEEAIVSKTYVDGDSGRWAYSVRSTAKEALARFVEQEARPGELAAFVTMLEHVRERLERRTDS